VEEEEEMREKIKDLFPISDSNRDMTVINPGIPGAGQTIDMNTDRPREEKWSYVIAIMIPIVIIIIILVIASVSGHW
jgi:hypothetical protein